MTLKKIHWPDPKWRAASRLDKPLHRVDEALTKWAMWFRLYAKHRGLSIEQLFGMGLMAGSSARARWVPKQQQWVDLAIAGLARTDPRLNRALWQQYIERDRLPIDKAAALTIDLRTYNTLLARARSAVMCALGVMESRDLTERALYVRDKREKSK